MRRHSILRFTLAATACLLVAGCGATLLPVVRSDAERLLVAQRLVTQRQFSHAIDLLKPYIEGNAGDAEVDGAIYLLGTAYLGMKDWAAASIEFERLLRDYPESDSAGAASFRLGEATFGQARPPDFDQEHTVKALEQWRGYLRAHPGHWLNPGAERRVAQVRRRLAGKLMDTARLYRRLRLYEPARVYYTRVESDYGDLDIVGDAWLGLAKVCEGEGKRMEALALLDKVEQRFPGAASAAQAARERQRLQR